METLLISDFDNIQPGREPRNDKYVYAKFNEESSADLAAEARRVHADGYQNMGFVNEEAVSNDGTLSADIDKARGSMVEYYAGIDEDSASETDQGVVVTLRKVGIAEGGSVTDLPAYGLCESTMYPEDAAALLSIPEPSGKVHEIGALARVEGTNPLATLELIRNILHESWTGKGGETWLFSIVKTTYDAFEDNFGDIAIRRIGDPVRFDDDRIGEQVELIPAVCDVDNFLDNIVVAMEKDENQTHRNRMRRSVLYFAEGMRDDELSEKVRTLRDDFRKMMGKRATNAQLQR